MDPKSKFEEVSEVLDILEAYEKTLSPEDIPFTPNRQQRRAQAKRDRATRKRDPRG